jgi:predicted SPOUT superfamily RNA methylase MTH1
MKDIELESQENRLKAMRQYIESRRKSEWDEQKDWDERRLRFRDAYNELLNQGVPKEKLQPYMLQFLEKEYEMNNRVNFIPEELQKDIRKEEPWT